MAVVTVQLWADRELDKKRALVEDITRAMVEHMNANPETLHVILQEIPKENWGRAGKLSSEA